MNPISVRYLQPHATHFLLDIVKNIKAKSEVVFASILRLVSAFVLCYTEFRVVLHIDVISRDQAKKTRTGKSPLLSPKRCNRSIAIAQFVL